MGDFEGSGGGMVWGILRVAEVVWCVVFFKGYRRWYGVGLWG